MEGMEGDLGAAAITHHGELKPGVAGFSLCKIKKRDGCFLLVCCGAALVQANTGSDKQVDFAQNQIRRFVLVKQCVDSETAFTKLCKEIGKSVNQECSPFD